MNTYTEKARRKINIKIGREYPTIAVGKWEAGFSIMPDLCVYRGNRVTFFCMKFYKRPVIGEQIQANKAYKGFFLTFAYMVNFDFRIWK